MSFCCTSCFGISLNFPKSAVESSFSYYNDHESSMGNKVSAWKSSLWQQTTKEDFEAGALNQVDVTTASGDVILETTTYEEQRLVSYDNSSSNSTTVESSEQVASSSSVETTLYALQDSFLDSTSPQATDGDSTVLYVYGKGNNIQRGIIMFDMPTLGSDAKITSATLYLNKHTFGEGSSLLGMHRVVNAWTESNVSWVSREMKAIGIRQAVISCLNPLRFSKYQLHRVKVGLDGMLPTT